MTEKKKKTSSIVNRTTGEKTTFEQRVEEDPVRKAAINKVEEVLENGEPDELQPTLEDVTDALEQGATVVMSGGGGSGDSPNEITYDPVLPDEEVTRLSYQAVKNAFRHAYKDVIGVDEIQEALAEDGFYKGPVNARVDNATRNAFAAYQRSLNRPPTGIPTVQDLESLGFEVVT